MFGKPRRYWLDVIERVVATFLAAFIGVYLAGLLADLAHLDTLGDLTNWALIQKAALAGIIAVLTFAKTIVSGWLGNKGTASALPLVDDPATPPPVPPNGDDHPVRTVHPDDPDRRF